MARYYVNDNVQPTGEHEVHQGNCVYLPKILSKTYLEDYADRRQAMLEARKVYGNVDGCAYCCPDCDTR